MVKNFVYFFDCEVFQNYFLVLFKKVGKDSVEYFGYDFAGEDNFISDSQATSIKNIIENNYTVAFNSIFYDLNILHYVTSSATCLEIYNLSNALIEGGKTHWLTMQELGIISPKLPKNHCDLIGIAPPNTSLKLLGARIHCDNVYELPIDPHEKLTSEDQERIKNYCKNDLDITHDLYLELKGKIKLRSVLSDRYNINLISKSDAQIAEAVIRSKCNIKFDPKAQAPETRSNFKFSIDDIDLTFLKNPQTENMKRLRDCLASAKFSLDKSGKPSIQNEKGESKIDFKIGDMLYTIGVGGLHSTEKQRYLKGNIYELDVVSYYPYLIVTNSIYPDSIGDKFHDIYREILSERVSNKNKNKTISDALKIILNSVFGKMNNAYSVMYDPVSLLKVTLSGQICLLYLIDLFHQIGIITVSANTDGIFISTSKYNKMLDVKKKWEKELNLELEITEFNWILSSSVNSYLALDKNKNLKAKGLFSDSSISRNAGASIINKAIIEFMTNAKPLADTIKNCTDIKDFILCRKSTMGTTWKGKDIGKVVRWFWSTSPEAEEMRIIGSGNRIPNTDKSIPILEPLSKLSKNKKVLNQIDLKRYEKECMDLLEAGGIY